MAALISGSIRAVVFDAVGTLIHPEPSAATVYTEAARRFGSQLGEAAIAPRFAAAFARQEAADRAAGWRTSEAREVARWRAIVAEVLDDVRDPEACFQYLYGHFARPSAWRSEPDAAGTFARLSGRGYRLAIASNFDSRLPGVLAADAFRGVPIVVSATVGWRKPARAFFQAVCHTVAAEAGEMLYVGDDLSNDYEGARAAGSAAVLFDPRGKASSGVTCLARLADMLPAT